ncbi:MAG: hypothetical protein ACXVDD_14990 [Polyangia bacterium]
MWSAFARATALAALALAGCGPRALDVTLTVDATGCTLTVPAGGSVSYQVEANGISAGSGSFCGGCLTVDSAIAGSDALIAFLRAHAPSCAGVHPGTTIAVRVTGWSSGGCPAANAPNFCADAPSQLVPDGTSNATLSFALTCKPQCSSICVPTTCMAQGKDCGAISDGCNMVLECGTCHPPLKCGVNTPNVCGR